LPAEEPVGALPEGPHPAAVLQLEVVGSQVRHLPPVGIRDDGIHHDEGGRRAEDRTLG